MQNPCHSWPFLYLILWVFSQVEILVLAVHGGDKDSTPGGGSCVFLKGKLLFKERGKEQKETASGKMFCPGKEKIHSITAEINYTEKIVRKRDEGVSKVCRKKMHPPKVEWQRPAFRFENSVFLEKERMGWGLGFFFFIIIWWNVYLIEKKRKMQIQEIFLCPG